MLPATIHYARPVPQQRSTLTVGVLAGLLVLVSVAMIAFGLPEQTLVQRRLLQLYSVPLSGALALGVVHLLGRLPALDDATRAVLVVAALANLVGVALMALGLLVGPDGLLPLGQALMWLTLGLALFRVVARLPRRDGRAFGLRPIESDDDRDEWSAAGEVDLDLGTIGLGQAGDEAAGNPERDRPPAR